MVCVQCEVNFVVCRLYPDTGIGLSAPCVFLTLRRLNVGCVDLTKMSSCLAGASTERFFARTALTQCDRLYQLLGPLCELNKLTEVDWKQLLVLLVLLLSCCWRWWRFSQFAGRGRGLRLGAVQLLLAVKVKVKVNS